MKLLRARLEIGIILETYPSKSSLTFWIDGRFYDFSTPVKSNSGTWDLPGKEALVFLNNDWIAKPLSKIGHKEPLRGENEYIKP